MEQFKITFWIKPFDSKSAFDVKLDDYLTSALVKKLKKDNLEIYQIKLLDIGLDSEFCEFELLKIDGKWEKLVFGTGPLSFLKHNVMIALDIHCLC